MIVNSEFPPLLRSARSRRIAVIAVSVTVLVMVAVSIHWVRVIAARYDSDPVAARDRATDTPSTAEPSPTSSTSPSSEPVDEPSEVGQTLTGKNTDRTLLQVRKIAAPAGREPPPGAEWFGIRGEVCVHADAPRSARVSWASWLAVDKQGAEYPGADAPWDDFPAQQFPTARIDPGTCGVGWVLIAVPEGTAKEIQTVVFLTNALHPAAWVV
jgi:hypothetical protein